MCQFGKSDATSCKSVLYATTIKKRSHWRVNWVVFFAIVNAFFSATIFVDMNVTLHLFSQGGVKEPLCVTGETTASDVQSIRMRALSFYPLFVAFSTQGRSMQICDVSRWQRAVLLFRPLYVPAVPPSLCLLQRMTVLQSWTAANSDMLGHWERIDINSKLASCT